MTAGNDITGGLLNTEIGRHSLLQSITELTRSVFAAKACSLMSHDVTTRELVFEAVAGEGAGVLEGRRIPATTGLAGWALASEEPIAVADVRTDPRWARDVATDTGFVPTQMSVYPLLHQEQSLGVLSVLDQGVTEHVGLAGMETLARISAHAAAVLAVVQAARASDAPGGGSGPLAGLERALTSASPQEREAAQAILSGLSGLLGTRTD